jgi:ABC-type cobalamin transport system permease subunit
MSEFHTILENTLTPVALISGVGLLLLSLVNRFNHALDRIRVFIKERKASAHAEEKEAISRSIAILYARCKLLRTSILLIGISITLSGAIVFITAVESVFQHELALTKEILLLLSIGSMVFSTILFVMDIFYSLKAIKLEVEE